MGRLLKTELDGRNDFGKNFDGCTQLAYVFDDFEEPARIARFFRDLIWAFKSLQNCTLEQLSKNPYLSWINN